MTYKCYSECDEAVVRNLVGARDPELAEKFERYRLESYIDDNKRGSNGAPAFRTVGMPSVLRMINFAKLNVHVVSNSASVVDVKRIGRVLMWQYWVRKCLEELETIKWMTVNTKPV
ncbi:putative E3 ubiquitin-protein ligase ARI2 [Drosera capensis]